MWNSLLKYYCIFSLIIVICTIIRGENSLSVVVAVVFANGAPQHTLLLPNMSILGPLWFLLALFWCKYIYVHIYNYKYISILSLTISILAVLLGRYIINLPLGITIGASAVVFYHIGVCLRSPNLILIRYRYWTIAIWGIAVFFSHLNMARFKYGIYPIDITGALGGTILIYEISKWICRTRLKEIITWFGRSSLYILCFHAIAPAYIPFSGKLYWITNIGGSILLTMLWQKAKTYYEWK